jgi:outer membrane protein assembly factor BamB
MTALKLVGLVLALAALAHGAPQLPAGALTFGWFTARFDADGTFSIRGQGWQPIAGTWRVKADVIELIEAAAAGTCTAPGAYRYRVESGRLALSVISDDCKNRRMILDRSSWRPAGEPPPKPPRRITLTTVSDAPALPPAPPTAGSWPSFRGPNASGIADGQKLPDTWDGRSGQNILWRTAIPGLAHSSPIVWGDRIFVTTAVSSAPNATFKPGLYGDGDASDDRSPQRWMLLALDKRTGRILWERVAYEGVPTDKRHIKSTYASATPATDGRVVVASFGSQGVYAYDVNGSLRWKLDPGRIDIGAYDIPTFEWGPASSPILWNGLVFLQYDTQADSFLLALDAGTGRTVWKADRDEQPSWGTPTLIETSRGPQLVTNASKFIRGYDPRTGAEIWRLGPTSNITAPTPVGSSDLIVAASGRRPTAPLFVVRASAAAGQIPLPDPVTTPLPTATGAVVAWSRMQRGPYMPTPLVYRGVLYVLNNPGIFDAYELESGHELYRARIEPAGSGFSASPVAADGRIYVPGEDGDIFVIEAGRTFKQLAMNPIGELLMATPALSDGVMYVRSAQSLTAIGRK